MVGPWPLDAKGALPLEQQTYEDLDQQARKRSWSRSSRKLADESGSGVSIRRIDFPFRR